LRFDAWPRAGRKPVFSRDTFDAAFNVTHHRDVGIIAEAEDLKLVEGRFVLVLGISDRLR